jgi:hypothetical protein
MQQFDGDVYQFLVDGERLADRMGIERCTGR